MQSQRTVASWAMPNKRYNESDPAETRSAYKHDADAIVYSAAFRRLSNKSQIVVKPERHGQFRSRLTHTLEVQQTAESIAIPLGLNVDLVDAIALGHDIGHTPFGHAGERAFQMIMRNEVLPLCDLERLRTGLRGLYGVDIPKLDTGNAQNHNHWLFHHAINSVRIMERKMRDISTETRDGVRQHGWSPWQPEDSVKFGVPTTYEAQAVALADQIASMCHDIEDLFASKHTGCDATSVRQNAPSFISANSDLTYQKTQDILDAWFLPTDADLSNSWTRRKRLQHILNSTIQSSKGLLEEEAVPVARAPSPIDVPLRPESEVGGFLKGFELFIRQRLIGGDSWFHHRDAVGAAIVNTVYTFFRYRQDQIDDRVAVVMDAFEHSISESYDNDAHFRVFRDAAHVGREDELVKSMKVIDYVSGMTDDYIMSVHDLALGAFR